MTCSMRVKLSNLLPRIVKWCTCKTVLRDLLMNVDFRLDTNSDGLDTSCCSVDRFEKAKASILQIYSKDCVGTRL